jgi:hypothetical protein
MTFNKLSSQARFDGHKIWEFYHEIAASGEPGPSTCQPEILASKLPPQHHKIDSGLTHKADLPYITPQKGEFLSTMKFALIFFGPLLELL